MFREQNKIYNDKSRYISIRHEDAKHLIKNGVLTISFVRFTNSLVDPPIKGLSREFVVNTSVEMRIKPFLN